MSKDEHLSEYLLLSVEFPGCGVISSEQLTLPKSDIIVIYTLIIYPASENLVTAAFPLRSRVASERLHPNLKKVNIFRSQEGLHVLSWRHISHLIKLRPLLPCAHEVLNQPNYPGDQGDTHLNIHLIASFRKILYAELQVSMKLGQVGYWCLQNETLRKLRLVLRLLYLTCNHGYNLTT